MVDFGQAIGEGAVIAITIKAIDEFSKELDKAEGKIMGFSKETVTSMVAVGAATVAVGAVLLDFAKEAAIAGDQQEAFNKKLGTDGIRILEQMQKATLGTVDKFKLMSAATSAVNRGVSKEALPAIADFAQRLADSDPQFKDTIATMNDLSTAIATGRTMTLARMGIMVDAKSAELNFAKANRISVDSLTESQKQMALQIMIMDQMKKKTQELPAPTVDAADKLNQLNAQFQDMKVEIGTAVMPAFMELITAIEPLLPQISKLAIELMPIFILAVKALSYFIFFLEQGFEALNMGVEGIKVSFMGWKMMIEDVIGAVKSLIDWLNKISFGAVSSIGSAIGSIGSIRSPVKRNDFIITKSGQVIEPSPQDTIFGMKNPQKGQITVYIDNVYGMDPSQLSRALKNELAMKLTL